MREKEWLLNDIDCINKVKMRDQITSPSKHLYKQLAETKPRMTNWMMWMDSMLGRQSLTTLYVYVHEKGFESVCLSPNKGRVFTI